MGSGTGDTTDRRLPALASGPAGAAGAAVLVAAWQAWLQHDASIVGLPFLAIPVLATLAGLGSALFARRAAVPDTTGLAAASLVPGLLGLGGALLVRELGPGLHGVSILSVGVALAAGGAGGFALARRRAGLGLAWIVLIVEVVAVWLTYDATILATSSHLYDLKVYVAGGTHALAGQPVYLDHALGQLPASPEQDFFLYPPILIPVLEVAAKLPFRLVALAWTGLMLLSALGAFRLLGLRWSWAVLLLAFPPLVKGVESGNVANLTFLLFVAGYRWGPALVVNGIFKVQNVIPAAWLLRERRWRDVAVGVAIVAVTALVTLPFTGIGSWTAWISGLGYRQQSQVAVPSLYGDSLAAVVPLPLFIAISLAAVAAALVFAGRRGLAGLGLASIVASPSLWPHGFLMALPAVLAIESATAVWLVLGLVPGTIAGLWLLVVAGALAVALARWPSPVRTDPADLLAGTRGPWLAEESAATAGR
jgi:Glycosyltransferase family 87